MTGAILGRPKAPEGYSQVNVYLYGRQADFLRQLAHDTRSNRSEIVRRLLDEEAVRATFAFALNDRVTKISGSSWTGRVVGFYSTLLVPRGYAVESENEPGSVQLYPEQALRLCP